MKNLAIITARGGSKRIPKKNIKNFCGSPVISYSIKVAMECGLFDEIMVSTDSEEIANISKEYGAKIPFYRSKTTSNDFATTRDVLLEVINEYENRGRYFDNICCLYPVAPFITKDKLIDSYEMLINNNIDEVLPAVRFSVPPQTGFFIRNGIINNVKNSELILRTQDCEPMYYDPGQFYWYKVSTFKNNPSTHIIKPFIISELEAQDVDNYDDWIIAELKYKLLHK